MTATTSGRTSARAAVLDRAPARRLAATEYGRFTDLLRTLDAGDWSRPTDCPAWDVRAMAGHVLGLATGREQHLTAEHDGVLVADVVAEWAARHGRPYRLRLTGPAGGSWSSGADGDDLELDAVQFCRLLSGRGRGEGLLAQQVPF